MQQKSEVFVVVPSYNHAQFVGKCLRSIIGQTLQPTKLHVIDDGSTDGSVAVIEDVLRECPFDCDLTVRSNRGLSATLNEGFASSSGQFFAYLGSDDLWLPTFLAEQTRLLTERPDARLAFSHAYVIDENDSITATTREWSKFADGDLLPVLLSGAVFSSPGVLYRRSALARHSWNEEARLEDYEMYLRLANDGEFARNEKLLSAWRRHSSNSSSDLPRLFPELLAAQERVAPLLGISRPELIRRQRRMKFEAVKNFARHGYRREAAGMFLGNIAAASSPLEIVTMAMRLGLPSSAYRWKQRRLHNAAREMFGDLEDPIEK